MLLLLLTLVSLASAEDDSTSKVSSSFTNDFEFRYYILDDRLFDPNDVPVFNYIEQVNRLNATVASGDFVLEAQVDEVALFATQYYLDDVLYGERVLVEDGVPNVMPGYSYANPEKIRARVEKDAYSLAVGDTYAAFGRGIALNLNRNVDIDIDTSIQGVKGVFRPGAWDITLVGGQANRQQVFQDNVNGNIFGDFRHSIGGFRVDRYGLGPASVGFHGVVYNFVTEQGWGPGFEQLGDPPDTLVGGANVELFGVGGIDWYVEGDVFGFPTGEQLPSSLGRKYDDKPGYAAYGSAAFYPGKTVWLVEGKRYFQAERPNTLLTPEQYEVVVAPTLEYERAITEDSSAAVNSNDIWGGRVRMDWAAKPGELVPYWSVAVYRDNELGGLHFNRQEETIVHSMVGLEYFKEHGAALINVGYRHDQRDPLPNGDSLGSDGQIHSDAAVKFPMGPLHGEVQIATEMFRWGSNALQQNDYTEVESGFTIQRGSAVALTWFTDFSDNPLVNSTGNLTDTLYGAAELQIKPTSALTVKGFYGAYKAGIRCSGGQCRQLPGFEGARFSVAGQF